MKNHFLIRTLLFVCGICIEVAPDILMAIALILSLLFFHRLNGIGIGTVISAVLVGLFVSLFHKTLPFIKTIESWKQNKAA